MRIHRLSAHTKLTGERCLLFAPSNPVEWLAYLVFTKSGFATLAASISLHNDNALALALKDELALELSSCAQHR